MRSSSPSSRTSRRPSRSSAPRSGILQRTEIGEVAEAFETKRPVGSSTMAQKENPVASENVCSLSRIVRSLVAPALENVPLWHERDLTNSAAERIILPHACVLIDEMLARTSEVFRTL